MNSELASVMIIAAAIGYLALVFVRALASAGELPEPFLRFVAWLKPLRFWHFLAFAAAGLAFTAPAGLVMFTVACVMLLYAWAWASEFLFLMHLNDNELPGRYDKPIWAAVLVFTGPLGRWAFKTYRAERWLAPDEAKPISTHAHDLI